MIVEPTEDGRRDFEAGRLQFDFGALEEPGREREGRVGIAPDDGAAGERAGGGHCFFGVVGSRLGRASGERAGKAHGNSVNIN
jgi:hypothetical protein